MWCTILNGGILLLWTGVWLLAPEWLYGVQRNWFPLSRDAYTVAMYGFIGFFKILFLTFNVVPFIALSIVARGTAEPRRLGDA
jgi:hypothetical protein